MSGLSWSTLTLIRNFTIKENHKEQNMLGKQVKFSHTWQTAYVESFDNIFFAF